jgi:cytochrome c peroxidase
MRKPVREAILILGLVAGCGSAPSPVTDCDLPNISNDHCADAHAMLLSESLPPARGNKFADNDQAAELGFYLFFDSNLGTGVSCATCHAPELAFVDRVPVSKGGKLPGTRNAPTTFNAAYLDVFFWDGRADSLWSQALGPIENPAEMAATRIGLIRLVAKKYAPGYERVFGPLPDLSSWPEAGKPGDAAYDALPLETRNTVDRVFTNVGKSLDAYMRKNASTSSPLDAFLKGDSTRLIDAAQKGLDVFLANGCQSCHSGPLLTDQGFHNVGFPSRAGAAPDPGRAAGRTMLAESPFNLHGAYADPEPAGAEMPAEGGPSPDDEGAFRTPSLRNVALTFPYGHDGALPSFIDVLKVHAPALDATDQGNLQAFMMALNGAAPLPPWNNWPTPQ